MVSDFNYAGRRRRAKQEGTRPLGVRLTPEYDGFIRNMQASLREEGRIITHTEIIEMGLDALWLLAATPAGSNVAISNKRLRYRGRCKAVSRPLKEHDDYFWD